MPALKGELVDEIHRTGVVDGAEFLEAGTEVRGRVPPPLAMRLWPLRLDAAAAVAAVAAGNGADGGELRLETEEEGHWEADNLPVSKVQQ